MRIPPPVRARARYRPFGEACGIGLATLFAVCVASAPLAGQDTTDIHGGAWFTGLSVGVPGYGGNVFPSFFTLGFHATHVRPGSPGGDLSIGTIPRAIIAGFVGLGARAGISMPLPLGEQLLLLPSGGASVVTAFSGDGGGAVAGGNLGIAAFVLEDGATGLRLGVTWHRFPDMGESLWLLEFGFVRRHP